MGVGAWFNRLTASGDPAPLPNAMAVPPDAAGAGGRRERALDDGHQVLANGLAEKVLHGWLQNRHQTLFPLTVNFRTLAEEQRHALARFMAVSLLAGPPGSGSRAAEAQAWLEGAGADPATVDTLHAALAQPPALHEALAVVADTGLAPYAYVTALVVLDGHDAATTPFLDYLAARLDLPSTVQRSANRRYRR